MVKDGTNDAQDMTLPPTHFEQIELAKLEQEHKLERIASENSYKLEYEREETKQSRHVMLTWVVCVFFVVQFALGLAYIIWQGNKGPSAKEQLRQEQYKVCVQAGGTWLPPSGTGGESICVISGKAVEQK